MNQDQYLLVLAYVAIVIVGILGFIKVLKVFNSPDGERYRRMRMQGPFVPLSEEEIAADSKRIKESSARPTREA